MSISAYSKANQIAGITSVPTHKSITYNADIGKGIPNIITAT